MSNPVGAVAALAAGMCLLAVLLPLLAAANNYGAGNFGACQYGSCSITISTSSALSLNITPTVAGLCTIQSDNVTVTTDNSNGYTLTMADTATTSPLTSGANTIAAGSGTQAAPVVLSMSSWGYRVDGLGGFGAGPTSAVSNGSPSSLTFAGVPGSASPNTIANTSAAAGSGQLTQVWYGVCANTGVTNGSYTTQLTYTAVTN